jgi:RimJ/RimL family protein N-acetyltransferase
MILTPQLKLLPANLALYEAVLLGNSVLSAVLGVIIPDKWTAFPEAILVSFDKIKSDPSLAEWFFHFIIHRADNKLIGTGGYKGHPSPEGMVEIGYEIISPYRGKGYATEAAAAFIQHAFSFANIQKVVAHTLPDYNASVSVLRKTGMQFVQKENHPEEGEVWLWEITRAQYDQQEKAHLSFPSK